MESWHDFVLACAYWRNRLVRPHVIGRCLLWLLAFQLCCSPLTMDLGMTLYSLGLDGALLLLDLQMTMLLVLMWTSFARLRRWQPWRRRA